MLKETLINYLKEHDIKYVDKGDKLQCSCLNPSHDDKNPSAYVDLKEGYFHCSSCGYHLNKDKLIKFIGGEFDEVSFNISEFEKSLEELSKEEVPKRTKVYLPKKYKDFNIPYRGISKETFEKVKAYITLTTEYYGNRIIIPMIDVYGKERSFEAVTVKGATPKILRPKVDIDFFGLENLIEHDEVFICEGIFNSLSFIDCGFSSVTNFGTGSALDKIGGLIKKGVKRVWLCGDPDSVNPKTQKSAGREFNKKLFYELRGMFEVRYFYYPELDVDANDLHKQKRLKEIIEYNKENRL
jgi:DNA primase